MESLFQFPRKIVLYLSTKLGVIKPWTNIHPRRRFDLAIERLENLEDFQSWSCFPRKMVLYSSHKFGTLKTWTNIRWLIKFELVRLQNKLIGNFNKGEMFLRNLKVCINFPEKWLCLCRPNLPLQSFELIFNNSEYSILAFQRLQKNF